MMQTGKMINPSLSSTSPSSPLKGGVVARTPGGRHQKRDFDIADLTQEPTETAREDADSPVLIEETKPISRKKNVNDKSSETQAPPTAVKERAQETSPQEMSQPHSRTERLADLAIERISNMPISFSFDVTHLRQREASELTESHRVSSELPKKVTAMMHSVLTSRFHKEVNQAETVIHIKLLQCSTGNRCARIMIPVVGWIVLEVEWNLSKGGHNLTEPRRIKRRNAAALGLRDLCDAKYGERTLLNNLCVDIATTLKDEATHTLLQTEKFKA